MASATTATRSRHLVRSGGLTTHTVAPRRPPDGSDATVTTQKDTTTTRARSRQLEERPCRCTDESRCTNEHSEPRGTGACNARRCTGARRASRCIAAGDGRRARCACLDRNQRDRKPLNRKQRERKPPQRRQPTPQHERTQRKRPRRARVRASRDTARHSCLARCWVGRAHAARRSPLPRGAGAHFTVTRWVPPAPLSPRHTHREWGQRSHSSRSAQISARRICRFIGLRLEHGCGDPLVGVEFRCCALRRRHPPSPVQLE